VAGSNPTRVSVVIPTYNAAPFIKTAIESVLAERSPNLDLEVIVADDGSTDDTTTVVADYKEQVQFLHLPHSGRPGKARNQGALQASHEYLAFLDADDACLPGRLSAQVGLLEATASDLAVCNSTESPSRPGVTLFDRLGLTARLRAATRNGVLENGFELLVECGCFVVGSSILVRRSRFLAVGLFDELIQIGEDYDFALRMALAGRVALDFNPRVLRRFHESNISSSRWKRVRDGILLVEKLGKIEAVARSPRLMRAVRNVGAEWRREQGSLLARRRELDQARLAWARSFSLHPSAVVAGYWLMSWLPVRWVTCLQALKDSWASHA
jgi:glycosyltransferase involved in cell wall biosynthesis